MSDQAGASSRAPLLKRAKRKLATLRAMPVRALVLLLPCAVVLGIAALALACLPFRVVKKYLGQNIGAHGYMPLATKRQAAFARDTGLATRTMARYVPWRSDCLRQAVAAMFLFRLAGLPYALHLGAAVEDDGFRAHAWLACGKRPVTGGISFDQFSTTACFVPARLVPDQSA